MHVRALDHIVLCVNDVEGTRGFYRRVLRLEPRQERPASGRSTSARTRSACRTPPRRRTSRADRARQRQLLCADRDANQRRRGRARNASASRSSTGLPSAPARPARSCRSTSGTRTETWSRSATGSNWPRTAGLPLRAQAITPRNCDREPPSGGRRHSRTAAPLRRKPCLPARLPRSA